MEKEIKKFGLLDFFTCHKCNCLCLKKLRKKSPLPSLVHSIDENLAFSSFSGMSWPVATSLIWIVNQSEPEVESPYAKRLPSWENRFRTKATVPSVDNLLGSRNSTGSLSKQSCLYITLKQENTYISSFGSWSRRKFNSMSNKRGQNVKIMAEISIFSLWTCRTVAILQLTFSLNF